jgi:hypothetical protein
MDKMIECQWCNTEHKGRCPWVSAFEFHPDRTVKRVEFYIYPAPAPIPVAANPYPMWPWPWPYLVPILPEYITMMPPVPPNNIWIKTGLADFSCPLGKEQVALGGLCG